MKGGERFDSGGRFGGGGGSTGWVASGGRGSSFGNGRGFGGGGGRGGGGRGMERRYTNPCLTMHQPWASLLVYGIKRIEGRSWPSPITGKLWIHAASKVPEPETIQAMEQFYREIYVVDGITEIEFPKHYPVSRLLGCVEVVGCVKSEELVRWEDVPESVRLEGLTEFCWLCENPQKLVIPFEMRGNQGVYNLERRIFEAAVRGLSPIRGPLPVKFPLPDPHDRFSLRPGSLTSSSGNNSSVEKSSRVAAAINGAKVAALQFSKLNQSHSASESASFENGRRASYRHDGSTSWGDASGAGNNSSVEKSTIVAPAINGAEVSAQQFPKLNLSHSAAESSRVEAAISGAKVAAQQFSWWNQSHSAAESTNFENGRHARNRHDGSTSWGDASGASSSSVVDTAISGAKVAVRQFSRQNQTHSAAKSANFENGRHDSDRHDGSSTSQGEASGTGNSTQEEQPECCDAAASTDWPELPRSSPRLQLGASNRLVSAAFRDLVSNPVPVSGGGGSKAWVRQQMPSTSIRSGTSID